MLIVGINGAATTDPTENGALRLLTESLASARKESEFHAHPVNTEIIHLHELGMGFHEGEFDLPPWTEKPFALLNEAAGIIFSSPVQNYTMTPAMSNFIDYFYSLEKDDTSHPFAGKVVGATAHLHTDGGMKTVGDIVVPLNSMGVLGAPYAGVYQNKYRNKRVNENRWQEFEHLLAGENVVRLAMILLGYRIDINNWL